MAEALREFVKEGTTFSHTLLSLPFYFLADRINGRAIGTVLRLSSSSVCDVKYCG